MLISSSCQSNRNSDTLVDHILQLRGTVLAVLASNLLSSRILVLIGTLATETIDSTEGVVYLYTLQCLTIGHVLNLVVTVHVLQSQLVHLGNQVAIVCKVQIEVHTELTNLDNIVGICTQLPTTVTHVTFVLEWDVLPTSSRRDITSGQHTYSLTIVEVDTDSHLLIEETDVESHITLIYTLSVEVRHLQ